MKRLLVTASISALLACVATAQSQVPATAYLLKVSVRNGEGRPTAGAEVRIDDTVLGWTDTDGQYFMGRREVPPGPHIVSVRLENAGIAESRVNGLDRIAANPNTAGLQLALRLKPVRKALTVTRSANAPPNADVVRIFYVTDRRDTGRPEPSLRYSSERSTSADLSRGIADVSIPNIHVVGELESPSWLRMEFNPDPARHVILRSVQTLATDPFYQQVAAQVERSSSREAVVVIHGYNTTFENAARVAAQISHDSGFDGAAILYTWPSQGRFLGYAADEDTVQWTAFHLRDFLEELAGYAHATKIHLIAHSMGNRALTSALQMIAAKGTAGPSPFDQVVLAAPDMSADNLALYAREIRGMSKRMTLYASANDDALLLSGYIHNGARAGVKGAYLLIAPGIDTVDASSVRTDFIGHNYFARSGSIIADIRKLLSDSTPPELRNLVPAMLRDLRYWVFPAGSR